jgi:predicted TIM-barrel fold metal-dependent hydrolase
VIDANTDEDNRIGPASFASTVNWDSEKRNLLLEEEGIVGEVLFPNTAPPFFPAGAISAHVPASPTEYERRYAGLQAHNRWLADFCAEMPGRRAGIAQLFLADVDRAIEEVRWAKEHGLMGVLLPSDHMLQLSNLYYPRFEPLWAACAELEMPIHRHAVVPSEAASEIVGDAAPLIGFTEIMFFIHRPITHLILSGVFERHPGLKLVMTENGAAKVLPIAQGLDGIIMQARADNTIMSLFGADAARKLTRLPSEYLRSNVYHGSFFVAADIEHRQEVGVDRMMWGADFPHHEGTHPYSKEALRLNLSGLPDKEIRQMTSGTAIDVYGFDALALQPVADRVGPTLEAIKVPLSLADISVDAKTYCPTFIDA